MTNLTLKHLEKDFCGGVGPGKLVVQDHGDGPEATVYLMDFEYDPVRITFGPEDEVVIHTDDYKWVMFSASQMLFLAGLAKKGGELTRRHILDDEELGD